MADGIPVIVGVGTSPPGYFCPEALVNSLGDLFPLFLRLTTHAGSCSGSDLLFHLVADGLPIVGWVGPSPIGHLCSDLSFDAVTNLLPFLFPCSLVTHSCYPFLRSMWRILQ